MVVEEHRSIGIMPEARKKALITGITGQVRRREQSQPIALFVVEKRERDGRERHTQRERQRDRERERKREGI